MRLAAVLLLFKEEAFIEAAVRAIYPHIDSICAVTSLDRNFAGEPVEPDNTLPKLLAMPDPGSKLRTAILRNLAGIPGDNSEARLRNAAMALDPGADYYLIVDSDEIWPGDVLRRCWEEVQRTQWAGYRVTSHLYFRKWNYRIVGQGRYKPLVFLRRGFLFRHERQVNWNGLARWKEYLRKGRKPKTVYFEEDLAIHHGSSVGNDSRMLTKLLNWGHKEGVDPEWFERVWKNFHPGMKDLHYYKGQGALYESVEEVSTTELPPEITASTWPDGWIDLTPRSAAAERV